MSLSSGYIVEFIVKGSVPEAAVVLSISGTNVRVLLVNGKETNIPEKKILYASNRSLTSVSDKEICKQNLININNNRKSLAEKIDLAEIRELLAEDPKFYELNEIAEFLYDLNDYDSIAALLRKLCEDKIYFKNKNNTYQPVSEDDLKQSLEQLKKKELQEKEESVLVEALKNLINNSVLDDCLKPYLQDLKDFVAIGEEANISKKFSNALSKASINNNRKVFQSLVKAEILKEDENLDLIKFRTPVGFSEEQKKEAENNCNIDIKSLNRIDLTYLKTWAIDSPGSKDRDDAFSFEKTDNGYTLWVHIADPSEIVKPDSVLDKEAARRGSSIYMPDLRINMFPEIISEEFLSLDEGKERIALTFKLDFSNEIELKSISINKSIIKLDKATEYPLANEMLKSDEWLNSAYLFSELLKAERVKKGAVIIPRQPELDVKVVEDKIIIEKENRDELTAGMIAEFMIWVNHAAARWFHENSIPALFRTQEGDSDFVIPECDSFDPVVLWNTLRVMRKTIVGPDFGKHYSLGVIGYTQISSPLRRYSDLLLHRQIKAFLDQQPYMTQEELNKRVMISDIAVDHAEDTMRDREKYYILKYLKQLQKNSEVIFDGVVVDSGLSEVNFYVDFLCSFRHCRKPNFDVTPGMMVKVKVNQIDLFDGIIRFDIRKS
ncbi:MAG: RNB domain-containing ribonuclease [Candidatus Riflebacteria bacterium]|nr:RNB domain-containing ribonuclease [Candidatus Riflebacteria bacterium]MBR4571343.1 RNB domain-containing ribonuclease [Candidatus Riflebacteria bacterium]